MSRPRSSKWRWVRWTVSVASSGTTPAGDRQGAVRGPQRPRIHPHARADGSRIPAPVAQRQRERAGVLARDSEHRHHDRALRRLEPRRVAVREAQRERVGGRHPERVAPDLLGEGLRALLKPGVGGPGARPNGGRGAQAQLEVGPLGRPGRGQGRAEIGRRGGRGRFLHHLVVQGAEPEGVELGSLRGLAARLAPQGPGARQGLARPRPGAARDPVQDRVARARVVQRRDQRLHEPHRAVGTAQVRPVLRRMGQRQPPAAARRRLVPGDPREGGPGHAIERLGEAQGGGQLGDRIGIEDHQRGHLARLHLGRQGRDAAGRELIPGVGPRAVSHEPAQPPVEPRHLPRRAERQVGAGEEHGLPRVEVAQRRPRGVAQVLGQLPPAAAREPEREERQLRRGSPGAPVRLGAGERRRGLERVHPHGAAPLRPREKACVAAICPGPGPRKSQPRLTTVRAREVRHRPQPCLGPLAEARVERVGRRLHRVPGEARPLLQERADLARHRGGGHGPGQQPRAPPLGAQSLQQRLLEAEPGGRRGAQAGDAGPRGVEEVQHRGLGEHVRGARARRVQRVAVNLGRPALVALHEHAAPRSGSIVAKNIGRPGTIPSGMAM